MSKDVEFKYELTDRYGETLYEALREKDFDRYADKETEYVLENTKVGGEGREGFVSYLESTFTFSKWKGYAGEAGASCEGLYKYLMENELPGGESEIREKYAREEVGFRMDIDSRDFGLSDDVDVAYTYGLIKLADLPQDVQRKMEFLYNRANKYDEKDCEIAHKLRGFSYRLEREACEKLIPVSGFSCDIHGGNVEFKEPVQKSEVLACPSCGHPVCPDCANCMEHDPATIDEGREYIASCEGVSGHAYCGYCGDYSVEFMLRFLKLVGCPIPPECEDFAQPKREARWHMTATVNMLPNRDDIIQAAMEAFDKGASGIIKIPDATGEIWGVPERHPEGWVVVICYPAER